MSGLFSSGPSSGDIRRAEEAAFKKEATRLRIEEQKLRQRESEETIQGEGIATTGAITIGSDAEQTATGGDEVQSIARGEEPVTEQDRWKEQIQAWRNTGLTGGGNNLINGGKQIRLRL
jgi:hypothetical protein